jgi:hypothetical protein
MNKGIAIGQTVTGLGDFRQSDEVCTVSPGGPGKVIPALKCDKCGHSEYIKEKDDGR